MVGGEITIRASIVLRSDPPILRRQPIRTGQQSLVVILLLTACFQDCTRLHSYLQCQASHKTEENAVFGSLCDYMHLRLYYVTSDASPMVRVNMFVGIIKPEH
jgi:hypothetical protein